MAKQTPGKKSASTPKSTAITKKPAASKKSALLKPQSTSPAGAVVEVGQVAPAFSLGDQHGKTHQLKDYQGQYVVLYFYPKDDTPGCTKEACAFRDAAATYTKQKAVVLGVSPDDTKSHMKFATKFNLPFALLADVEKQVCQAYGVWVEKSMYGKKYMGVARTTYLIDPKGKVAARWDKVTVDGHEAEVLQKLAELG